MSEPISELRSVTCHMGSHSVTCHPTEVNVPRLNPSQAGTQFTYPGGMEGWVDLGGWLHPEMVYLPTGSHPSQYYILRSIDALLFLCQFSWGVVCNGQVTDQCTEILKLSSSSLHRTHHCSDSFTMYVWFHYQSPYTAAAAHSSDTIIVFCSSSSSTTVGSMPVGVWRHSYYRCPPLPI